MVSQIYIADGGEPLWVTSVWLALKFVVVWLALRVSLPRAVLAVVAMVIVSTTVLIASEIIVPASLPLLLILVSTVVVETTIEAVVLVWVFRLAWSRRFGLLFVANVIALTVSVVVEDSRAIDKAVRAEMVPVGTTRIELLQIAPGPTLERSVDQGRDICPAGTARVLEYHAPIGVVASLLPLQQRGAYGTVVAVCLDEKDRVVRTASYTD